MATAEAKAQALELKKKGNASFAKGDFRQAVSYFTGAIKLDGTNHVYYSNRSGAHASSGAYDKALEDADMVIKLKPDWPKGYSRRGTALQLTEHYEDAIASFQKGLQIDPNNQTIRAKFMQCQELLNKTKKQREEATKNFYSQLPIAFSGDVEERALMMPQTQTFAKDKAFITKLRTIQGSPQKVSEYIQDIQIQTYIQAALYWNQAGWDKLKKPEKKPAKVEKKEETKVELTAEQQASQELKQKGNVAYKARKFDEAIEWYTKAFETDSTNMVFLSNRAAVHFEKGDYDTCIADCEEALAVGKKNYADFALRAKATHRIGNALMKKEEYEKAIEAYKNALTDDRNARTLSALKKAEKIWEEKKKLAYIDPELSLAAKKRGNDFFKGGQYPEAVKEYTEAIKRDPNNCVPYSNRAAAYTKLMAYPEAIKDCDKAIEIDPKYLKSYIRKGYVYEMKKEYYKCLTVYDKGLAIDPTNREMQQGRQKAMMAIQMMQGGGGNEQAAQAAMQDPEIQKILRDPVIQKALQDMKNDPNAAAVHLKDPIVAKKIETLIAAGIVRLG